jgi:hypothetical protein
MKETFQGARDIISNRIDKITNALKDKNGDQKSQKQKNEKESQTTQDT